MHNKILTYTQLKTVHTYHYEQCIISIVFSFLGSALPKYRIDLHTFLQIVLYNLYDLLICSVLPTLHLLIQLIYCLLPDPQNEEKHSR